MRDIRLLLILLPWFLGVSGCGTSPEEVPLDQLGSPNVVFILADDLGYGDLGSYGQEVIQTPNLDRMAAEGVRFTDFYAGATVCAPSRSVLMTGLHTGHTYVRGNREAKPMGQLPLPEGTETLARLFKKAGYRTGLVGKWGLGGPESTGHPNRQGFDFFFGYLCQRHAHNYFPEFLFENGGEVRLAGNEVPGDRTDGAGKATSRAIYTPDLMVRKALDFIEENRDRSFFLYFASTIPHANNEAGEEGMEIPNLGPYEAENWPAPQKGLAAMISRFDADVGQLVERIREYGLEENTIFIFSSDNGPHAEGGNDPDFFDSNGPLRGIKRDLYEGGIRVPMIVKWKDTAPAGEVSEYAGYFADFMPTFAEILGIDEVPPTDGISVMPAILGQREQQPEHEYLYWEFYERGSAQAVRAGKWKAVRKPMLTGPVELYDLSVDISEESDISAQNPEIVDRLVGYMESAHVPSELWTPPQTP